MKHRNGRTYWNVSKIVDINRKDVQAQWKNKWSWAYNVRLFLEAEAQKDKRPRAEGAK